LKTVDFCELGTVMGRLMSLRVSGRIQERVPQAQMLVSTFSAFPCYLLFNSSLKYWYLKAFSPFFLRC